MGDRPALRFEAIDIERAYDAWGCNCGPAAVAAIAELTLDALRPHLGDFEAKRYTNPTLMWSILDSLGIRRTVTTGGKEWPVHGLARIQWEGPWTAPGVPVRARYRHTHWVATHCHLGQTGVFDVNAMSVGGWITPHSWEHSLVPWLLREAVPRANGKWHLTHVVEIDG